jgi:hypothetical protein
LQCLIDSIYEDQADQAGDTTAIVFSPDFDWSVEITLSPERNGEILVTKRVRQESNEMIEQLNSNAGNYKRRRLRFFRH